MYTRLIPMPHNMPRNVGSYLLHMQLQSFLPQYTHITFLHEINAQIGTIHMHAWLFIPLSLSLQADLAQLYIKAGLKNMGTVFLLTDAQVPDEKFLVLINDLLASGEIPDLFAGKCLAIYKL